VWRYDTRSVQSHMGLRAKLQRDRWQPGWDTPNPPVNTFPKVDGVAIILGRRWTIKAIDWTQKTVMLDAGVFCWESVEFELPRFRRYSKRSLRRNV